MLVLLRQLVAALHGYAHWLLDIPMQHWQHAYIVVVIAVGPLAGLVWLWWQRSASAAWLVTAIVAAGSLFGLYFHFGPINPDHVSTLPELPGRTLFVVSAWMLLAVEVLAVLGSAAAIVVSTSRRREKS